MDLEDVKINEDIEMLPGDIPAPDKPGSWSKEVALRVDKYILEQVEALEDKVAAASMQVPVRVVQNSSHSETTLCAIHVSLFVSSFDLHLAHYCCSVHFV